MKLFSNVEFDLIKGFMRNRLLMILIILCSNNIFSQVNSNIGQYKESTVLTCGNYKFEIYNQTSHSWSIESPIWWGIVTPDFIVATSDGSLYNADDPDAVVDFDSRGRISSIGRVDIDYDSRGRISSIGRVDIDYDSRGRISSIGRVNFDYDSRGRISSIGTFDFEYNRDGRLIEIDDLRNGWQEIFYDSQGRYRGRELNGRGLKCSNVFEMQ